MKDFYKIYQDYHQRVFSFILSFVGDRDLAKDILQDVFIKLWETSKNKDLEKLEGIIFTIAKNKVIDHARKETVRRKYKERVDLNISSEYTEQTLDYRETKYRILNIIKNLPPKRKRIFTLSRFEGKSYQEIADEMNISKNTVEVQMVKALKHIKASL